MFCYFKPAAYTSVANFLLPYIRNIHPTTARGRLTWLPLVFRIADLNDAVAFPFPPDVLLRLLLCVRVFWHGGDADLENS
jgi:hypothetical protein